MDSDSDDSLLAAAPTFGRKRRRATKDGSKSKADSILEEGLKFSRDNLNQEHQITNLKKEEVCDGELVAKTREVQNNNEKKSRKETLNEVEGINDSENDDDFDHDRRLALVLAADTAQTSSLGVRPTLFFKRHCNDLPKTEEHAIEYLGYILAKQLKNSTVTIKTAIVDPLVRNIRAGTLENFLSERILLKNLDQEKNIPAPLVQWLFLVSCAERMWNLSDGAFKTLSSLWKADIVQDQGTVLKISELATQLDEWFGCRRISTKNPKDSGGQEMGTRNVRGLKAFLTLWGLGINRRLVAFEKNLLLSNATKCILALTWAGIDSHFHSHENNISLCQPLRRLLGELLLLCEHSCHENKDTLNKWMTSTADAVVSDLSQLGPGAKGADDDDDTNAWLSHSLIVRLLSSTDDRGRPNQALAEFCFHVVARILRLCFHKEEWDKKITTTIAEAIVPEKYVKSIRWRALASSYLALFLILEERVDILDNGPKCLATIETSYLCLQAAMSLFYRRIRVRVNDEEDSFYYGDEEEENDVNKEEFSAIFNIFQMIEVQADTIRLKSQRRAIESSHLRRANFYANCIRQYCRLEKETFQSRKKTIMQSSLDSWVSTKQE